MQATEQQIWRDIADWLATDRVSPALAGLVANEAGRRAFEARVAALMPQVFAGDGLLAGSRREQEPMNRAEIAQQVRTAAEERRKADPTLTLERATVAVLDEHPGWYDEYERALPAAARQTSERPQLAPIPDELRVAAEALRRANPAWSEARALTEAAVQHPALYDRFDAEQRARAGRR